MSYFSPPHSLLKHEELEVHSRREASGALILSEQNLMVDRPSKFSAFLSVSEDPRSHQIWSDDVLEEAMNAPFCPLQEKFHIFVLRGLRNISEAP